MRTKAAVYFISLLAGSLWLSFSIHTKESLPWKSEIWADRAGYYVYLPAAFLHEFRADRFPEGITGKTGNGFDLQRESNAARTKYTYGVSFLVAPFFLATHLAMKALGMPGEEGFAQMYYRMTDVAAVCYLILGLIFLNLFLKFYFRPGIRYFLLTLVYLATNLLYYTVVDPLMSHVYSFFLFSLFAFALKKFIDIRAYRWFVLLVLAGSLAVLVRPTNVLIWLLFFFWDIKRPAEALKRAALILKPVYLFTLIALFSAFLIPQLLYWKAAFGSWFHYSYGDEGFKNWLHPYIAEVWFAPLNGLFLYTPLALLVTGSMVYMIIRRIPNGIFLFILFLLVSYLCASWETWYFGCSFGQRSFVEFYAVFIFSLGIAVRDCLRRPETGIRILLAVCFLLLIHVNQRMVRSYEKCFFGSVWDFGQYQRLLAKADLGLRKGRPQTFTNDFENHAMFPGNLIIQEVAFSGKNAATFDKDHPRCGMVVKFVWEFEGDPPERIRVSFMALKRDSSLTCTAVECTVTNQDDVIFSRDVMIDDQIGEPNRWHEVSATIRLPELHFWESMMVVSVRSDSQRPILIDNLACTFE